MMNKLILLTIPMLFMISLAYAQEVCDSSNWYKSFGCLVDRLSDLRLFSVLGDNWDCSWKYTQFVDCSSGCSKTYTLECGKNLYGTSYDVTHCILYRDGSKIKTMEKGDRYVVDDNHDYKLVGYKCVCDLHCPNGYDREEKICQGDSWLVKTYIITYRKDYTHCKCIKEEELVDTKTIPIDVPEPETKEEFLGCVDNQGTAEYGITKTIYYVENCEIKSRTETDIITKFDERCVVEDQQLQENDQNDDQEQSDEGPSSPISNYILLGAIGLIGIIGFVKVMKK